MTDEPVWYYNGLAMYHDNCKVYPNRPCGNNYPEEGYRCVWCDIKLERSQRVLLSIPWFLSFVDRWSGTSLNKDTYATGLATYSRGSGLRMKKTYL